MKRFAIGLVLTASVAVGFLYAGSTRTSAHSRLIATSDAALANEDPFVAIAAFSGAIALRADVMLAHLKRGETYHSRGDLETAVAALELATERYPIDPSAFMLLADLAERDGDLSRARRLLVAHDTVTAYVPATERLPQLFRTADVSMQLEDHADAAVRLESAAALGSPASTLLVRLADAHWRAGATGRARAVVSDGLRQHPDSSALIALKRRFD